MPDKKDTFTFWLGCSSVYLDTWLLYGIPASRMTMRSPAKLVLDNGFVAHNSISVAITEAQRDVQRLNHEGSYYPLVTQITLPDKFVPYQPQLNLLMRNIDPDRNFEAEFLLMRDKKMVPSAEIFAGNVRSELGIGEDECDSVVTNLMRNIYEAYLMMKLDEWKLRQVITDRTKVNYLDMDEQKKGYLRSLPVLYSLESRNRSLDLLLHNWSALISTLQIKNVSIISSNLELGHIVPFIFQVVGITQQIDRAEGVPIYKHIWRLQKCYGGITSEFRNTWAKDTGGAEIAWSKR